MVHRQVCLTGEPVVDLNDQQIDIMARYLQHEPHATGMGYEGNEGHLESGCSAGETSDQEKRTTTTSPTSSRLRCGMRVKWPDRW